MRVMRKANVAKLAVPLLLLLAAFLAGGYFLRCESNRSFVQDALQTAAYEFQKRLAENPEGLSSEAIKQVFITHHNASVSPIWFDDLGNPVDAWGTPFRVSYDQARPVAWVLCESAGPDRSFGTSDDLSFRSEVTIATGMK